MGWKVVAAAVILSVVGAGGFEFFAPWKASPAVYDLPSGGRLHIAGVYDFRIGRSSLIAGSEALPPHVFDDAVDQYISPSALDGTGLKTVRRGSVALLLSVERNDLAVTPSLRLRQDGRSIDADTTGSRSDISPYWNIGVSSFERSWFGSFTLEVGIASGPWATVKRWSGEVLRSETPGAGRARPFITADGRERLMIEIPRRELAGDDAYRLVARDSSGRVLEATGQIPGEEEVRFYFDREGLELREAELQSRPFQWNTVEISR